MPSINILETSHFYELTPPVANPELPVLVFVHGWLLSRHYWQPLMQLLQDDYRCLAYDARGFGESQANSNAYSSAKQLNNLSSNAADYSLKAYANDLNCLLKKLEIKRAWIIGHSLGGSVALWAAELAPEVVQGIICLNAGGGIYLKEEFERFRNTGQQIVKFRPRWLCHVPFLDWAFARMMVARPLEVKWGRQRLLDFVQADAQAAVGALLESTTEAEVHFLPQLVSRLNQPVYFIAGEEDQVMELKYVNHLASFHSSFCSGDSNVFTIPNCGHLGMVEATEEVAQIMRQVLQQNCP